MTQKQFAEYFRIPYRTLEDWERGVRQEAAACFLAFDKAKNAHMWRGSPIRISMYGNQSLLRASTATH